MQCFFFRKSEKDWVNLFNKLAKARKTRKSPHTLGLKKFGLVKLVVEKVWDKIFFSNFLGKV